MFVGCFWYGEKKADELTDPGSVRGCLPLRNGREIMESALFCLQDIVFICLHLSLIPFRIFLSFFFSSIVYYALVRTHDKKTQISSVVGPVNNLHDCKRPERSNLFGQTPSTKGRRKSRGQLLAYNQQR